MTMLPRTVKEKLLLVNRQFRVEINVTCLQCRVT